MDITDKLVALYKDASTKMPDDVVRALEQAKHQEQDIAKKVISDMLKNIELAKKGEKPLCQDTGTPIFYVRLPKSMTLEESDDIRNCILDATRIATQQNILRPNAVDPLTNKNTGEGTGKGIPEIHIQSHDGKGMVFDLMLKGGGCENVGAQYKLPDLTLDAGRDLEGVRRCILDAAHKAQGRGCSPGIIGACIGGSRSSGMEEAKRQLFRRIDDTTPEAKLDMLEKTLHSQINHLGIGPMGLGGNTTVLGVKIGILHRIPASYYVSVSYMCWSARRKRLVI